VDSAVFETNGSQLRASECQIQIDWTVLEEGAASRLRLCWKESGGPPVRQTGRKGFGSKLIEVSLDRSEVVFAAEGVSCALEMIL
jgi:two-component sensor histidine kinase